MKNSELKKKKTSRRYKIVTKHITRYLLNIKWSCTRVSEYFLFTYLLYFFFFTKNLRIVFILDVFINFFYINIECHLKKKIVLNNAHTILLVKILHKYTIACILLFITINPKQNESSYYSRCIFNYLLFKKFKRKILKRTVDSLLHGMV